MIRRVVKKLNLDRYSSIKDDLDYWLSKTSEERVSAVGYLRKQNYGSSIRLQRTVRVIKREQ